MPTRCRWLVRIASGVVWIVGLWATAIAWPALAGDNSGPAWIWLDEGDPATAAPAGKAWFRLEAKAAQPSTGQIDIACDDRFVLWVNGRRLGQGDAGKVYRYNLSGIVDAGTNVISVEADNDGGPAGLLVRGGILYQNTRGDQGYSLSLDGGPQWRATRQPPADEAWLERNFDDSTWQSAKVIARHSTSPWRALVFADDYLSRYTLADGFQIERIAEPEMVGTLIAMTWGQNGRILASRERGALLSVIDADGDGRYDRVVEFSRQVQNCQGLCNVFGDIYAIGEGPQGVGIYRLRDVDGDDRADTVELVTLVEGAMRDHGPHDVVYGPDGWLYYNQGNMAQIAHAAEPTTPVKHYYEGYLLEPKFEDARGHAAGFKAPGGTIWRFTPDGSKWWLRTAGFRNEYDMAFNSAGELFAFDADMEWDVGQPWYRPCRVNHCVPGAEFGWRSGAAKWPAWYFDSLPATVDIGRGSPTGIVFYEHRQFPQRCQGSLVICDWSMGRIMAVRLEPDGATFKGSVETLITGNPLNVSDIEVDRDGSLVFVTGGRNSEGGIYRVRYSDGPQTEPPAETPADALAMPQLQSAWARQSVAAIRDRQAEQWQPWLEGKVRSGTPAEKCRALVLLAQFGPKPSAELLLSAAGDGDAAVRRTATMLLADHPLPAVADRLSSLLSDADPQVRRRACEAFVWTGLEPPVEPLLELLGCDDRWLRFAARNALERLSADRWRDRALGSADPHVVLSGLLALYRIDPDGFPGDLALDKLAAMLAGSSALPVELQLDALRMVQLALLAGSRGPAGERIARRLLEQLPQGDDRWDMEAARIVTVLQTPGAAAKLVDLLESAAPRQEMQIHYALVLRYLQEGWTFELKRRVLDWYDNTHTWEGGASFAPYLANIVGEQVGRFTPDERAALLRAWKQRPFATRLLIERSRPEEITDFADVLSRVLVDLQTASPSAQRGELTQAVIEALGRSGEPATQAALRKLFDEQPDFRNALARAMARQPDDENWPYLVRSLDFADPTTLQMVIAGLQKSLRRPDAPAEIRALILAGLSLDVRSRASAANLLARWTGSPHRAGRDGQRALAYYQEWFRKHYPGEPPPELPEVDPSRAGYTWDQLVDFLENNPAARQGDVERGKEIFTKANCVKCHQFGTQGQGIGPDLTSVRRRFQQREIVESILLPSKVISDQYRSVTVVTSGGLVHTGMPVRQPGSDKLVLLLPDATRLEIAADEIEETLPAAVSAMPEGLLKDLSLEEIADLFALLETSRFNEEQTVAGGAAAPSSDGSR